MRDRFHPILRKIRLVLTCILGVRGCNIEKIFYTLDWLALCYADEEVIVDVYGASKFSADTDWDTVDSCLAFLSCDRFHRSNFSVGNKFLATPQLISMRFIFVFDHNPDF